MSVLSVGLGLLLGVNLIAIGVAAAGVSEPAGGKWRTARYVPWFGPGLYGNKTACGQKMTRWLKGVAHRTLPCGTKIRLQRNDGSSIVVKVVDRGPYPRNTPRRLMPLDLTARTMCRQMLKPFGKYPKNGCHSMRNVKWRVLR